MHKLLLKSQVKQLTGRPKNVSELLYYNTQRHSVYILRERKTAYSFHHFLHIEFVFNSLILARVDMASIWAILTLLVVCWAVTVQSETETLNFVETLMILGKRTKDLISGRS